MTTSRLELPFGYIQLLLNGKPIEFEYEKSEYVRYWDENDIEIKPLVVNSFAELLEALS